MSMPSRRAIPFGRMIALMSTLAALAGPAAAATSPSADGAWARAPIGAAGAMALYLTLHGGTNSDRLVSVDSDVAGMAMLHESMQQDGMSSMRMLDGVDLPAGATLRLAPGGMHVMLEDLRTRLVPGATIHATLHFQHAAPVTVTAIVRPAGAPAP